MAQPGPTVESIFAPQQAQLAQQQQARATGLQNLVGSILASLKQPHPDAYGAAAQDQVSAANGAAQSLKAANPDPQTQAMLQAINAPQAQRDSVGAQNNVVFNGNAALGQYTGGALPAGVFAQDQAARSTYLDSLPATVGQSAIQGLGHLNALASKENTDFAAAKGTATRQAAKDAFDQAYKTHAAGIQDAKLTMQQHVDAFNQTYKVNAQSLSVAKMNQSASQFSRRMLNSDRSYAATLQSLGLRTAAAQRATLAYEYKLANGGVTPDKIAVLKADAAGIASNGLNGAPAQTIGGKAYPKLVALNFGQTLDHMRMGVGHGAIPLSMALQAMKQEGWNVPAKYNKLMGGQAQSASPFAISTMGSGLNSQFAKVAPFITSGAQRRGLDPSAVIAVSQMEGAGGGIGDNGTSFGPWQLHIGGALPSNVGAKGSAYAHQWAWSPAGINYALNQMAKVARGLSGPAAVDAIVRRFERPANPDSEVAGAGARYR